ncbi:MAG: hypothetical protein GY792_02640 [Gammaproteobacteria bacterium]|nr:hypothetical protein [Gammaproteobacteria bacterium]
MVFRRYTSLFTLCICAILTLSSCSKDVDYVPPAGTTGTVITHYSYDKLVIDGNSYSIDLMILPGGKVTSWEFNRDTHVIAPMDFQNMITDKVKTVIIGSGYHGQGIFDDEAVELVKKFQARGVFINLLPTSDAVNLFNASSKQGLLTFLHIRN